jgi:transposase-like protein
VKIDRRTLSHETSETIRRMAVKRVLEGETPSAVMKSYGLCRTTIYPWLRAHKEGGEGALYSRPAKGRPSTIVAAYVQSLEGRLELLFLPGYAPDLNPDEFVGNHLRQNCVTKKPLRQNQ